MTKLAFAIVVLAGWSAVLPGEVKGVTFAVNATVDAVDVNPGDGVCEIAAGSGVCTLRAAVQEANAVPGADEIALPEGTYALTIPGTGEDLAASGDLDVLDDLTVTGSGAVVIEAPSGEPIFQVFNSVSLDLVDVTLAGDAIDMGLSESGLPGGAVRITGCTIHGDVDVRIRSVIIDDSVVTGVVSGLEVVAHGSTFDGGGIVARGAFPGPQCRLDLQDSVVRHGSGIRAETCGNQISILRSGVSENVGAGITFGDESHCVVDQSAVVDNGGMGISGSGDFGYLTVSNSRIAGNTGAGISLGNCTGFRIVGTVVEDNVGAGIADSDDCSNGSSIRTSLIRNNHGAGSGGGLSFGHNSTSVDPALTIDDTTFADNTARDGGGMSTGGRTLIRNSTFTGNRAANDGGAIVAGGEFVSVVLANVTIVDNVADADASGSGDGGGAVANPPTEFSLRNTVIAGNRVGANVPSDCVGAGTSGGYNLIGTLDGCVLTGDTTGNLVGVDPLVAPLADNGGATPTRALLPGSPAINAGNPAPPGSGGNACEADDQRDVTRPQGLRCDIGAYESSCDGGAVTFCDDHDACTVDACRYETGDCMHQRIPACTTTTSTSTTSTSSSFSTTVRTTSTTSTTTTSLPPPVGGTCGAPIVLPPAGGTFTGTTTGKSALVGTCAPGSTAPELVYQWTPTTSGRAVIETCSATQTTFDTVLYLRQGSCAAGTQLACNDDTAGCGDTLDVGHPSHGSRLTPTVTAGQTYFIVVDGFAYSQGHFALTVTPPAGP